MAIKDEKLIIIFLLAVVKSTLIHPPLEINEFLMVHLIRAILLLNTRITNYSLNKLFKLRYFT